MPLVESKLDPAAAHDYADRYSAQDTIREQGNIYLNSGTRLLSTGGNQRRFRC